MWLLHYKTCHSIFAIQNWHTCVVQHNILSSISSTLSRDIGNIFWDSLWLICTTNNDYTVPLPIFLNALQTCPPEPCISPSAHLPEIFMRKIFTSFFYGFKYKASINFLNLRVELYDCRKKKCISCFHFLFCLFNEIDNSTVNM